MGLFFKLFGTKSQEHQPQQAHSQQHPPEDLITVYDEYGRQLQITREAWRTQILPGNLEKAWNDPAALDDFITRALTDGFHEDMLKPAQRLVELAPNDERAILLLAVTYNQNQQFAQAESLLNTHMAAHGQSGILLTNLAKAQAGQNRPDEAEKNLRRALELDPNQGNAIAWALQLDTAAGLSREASLQKIAAIPGAFRPQLDLAKLALNQNNLPQALRLYEQSLAAAPTPKPTDLLMSISGDLGQAGHLPDLLRLTTPHYDVAYHGVAIGNNLIKANLDSGHPETAAAILRDLHAQNRPDWASTLNYWDTELAKRNIQAAPPPDPNNLQITQVVINGPIWLDANNIILKSLPPRPANAPRIAFLGSSVTQHASAQVERQLSDTQGRLSRAVPLFLAEQVFLLTDATPVTLTPWVQNHHGFVLSGAPWSNEDAAYLAKEQTCSHIVTSHLDVTTTPWTLRLTLIDANSEKTIFTTTCPIGPGSNTSSFTNTIPELLAQLWTYANAPTHAAPEGFHHPQGSELPNYFLRTEQSLAIQIASLPSTPASFLYGTDEILTGLLHLSASHPANPIPRFLLLTALTRLQKSNPQAITSHLPTAHKLSTEHPLPPPARTAEQSLLTSLQ